ncbi:hypothetical protein QBC39DRAFT_398082 [Podospora conica]|nr:hypothetical protein QBC39DRAFT_398082 [Schizothecium conicum]
MSNYTAPAAPTATPAAPASPPETAILGGVPTIDLDAPICAVFLALFLGGAILNMAIYQINRRHGYKFFFSGLLFGFCMARILALTMRIVWAAYPTNISVAIASQIFTAAGVLLLFVTNLIFTQRILRAYHPFFGWHPLVTRLFHILVALVVAVLLLVISATVQSFFTLDPSARDADRTIQLVAAVFLATVAGLPLPAAAAALVVPRRTRVDRFGEGTFRAKFRLLVTTTALLFAGAAFRAGAAFHPAPLRAPETWYHSKPAYYLANFGVELAVVYLYALARFDKRFYVPDGSSAPGHYSCAAAAEYGGSAAAVVVAARGGGGEGGGGRGDGAGEGGGARGGGGEGVGGYEEESEDGEEREERGVCGGDAAAAAAAAAGEGEPRERAGGWRERARAGGGAGARAPA